MLKRKNQILVFPETLEGLKLIKILSNNKAIGAYSLAIYKDQNNKQMIVKMWSGSFLSADYKWLKNETEIYKLFNKIKLRSKVKIPRLIKIIKERNKLYLIIDFIDGKDLELTSSKKKVEVFIEIIKFLSQVNFNTIKESKFKIVQRKPSYWIKLFPLILMLTIYKHPYLIRKIIVCMLITVPSFLKLLGRKELSLVHRDLNDYNVLVKENKYYLIDLELVSLADPLLEVSMILLKYSLDKNFINNFINNHQIKELISSQDVKKIVTAYVLILSLYDLCFKNGFHKSSLFVLNEIYGKKYLI